MSAILNAIGGCFDWRHAQPATDGRISRIQTCSIAIPLGPDLGDLLGVMHYFVPSGLPDPVDGVYSITAKVASKTDSMVVGDGYARADYEVELDCIQLITMEHQLYPILPVLAITARPYNIHDRVFDMDGLQWISTAKKASRFTCYFPEEGRFTKSTPKLSHNAMLHVTGRITGTGPEKLDRLAVQILDMDYVAVSTTAAPSPAAVTPTRAKKFAWGRGGQQSSPLDAKGKAAERNAPQEAERNVLAGAEEESLTEQSTPDESATMEAGPSTRKRKR